MFDWEIGPPEPREQAMLWEQEVHDEYALYLSKLHGPAVKDGEYMTFEEFKEEMFEKQRAHWLDEEDEFNDFYKLVE